jgi:1,4-alpha-glucan branching enzyme
MIQSIVGLKKADPFFIVAHHTCICSLGLDYKWDDSKWMKNRQDHNALDKPYSVYEVHLGSWKRHGKTIDFGIYWMQRFSAYVKKTCYSVSLCPSWSILMILHGNINSGYFAPTSSFGIHKNLWFLDRLTHQAGIGVILDWVPSHRWRTWITSLTALIFWQIVKGYHPDWKSLVFNYGRNEVRSF